MTVAVATKNQAASSAARGLIGRLAGKYGVDRTKFYDALVKVAFRQPPVQGKNGEPQPAISQEEMLALLLVCEQYDLNPFLKQIYAFKSKSGAIVPVVGIDGWIAILNHNKDYDGLSVKFSEKTIKVKAYEKQYAERQPPATREVEVEIPESCECTIFRKGLSHPISIPEYANEVFVASSPVWRQYPKRMLRHKAVIQCARIAFGVTGIYDEDEARNIIVSDGAEDIVPVTGRSAAAADLLSEPPSTALPCVSDKMLESVVAQAQKHGDWNLAFKWIDQSVPAEQLEYARAFVKARQLPQAAPIPSVPSEITPI